MSATQRISGPDICGGNGSRVRPVAAHPDICGGIGNGTHASKYKRVPKKEMYIYNNKMPQITGPGMPAPRGPQVFVNDLKSLRNHEPEAVRLGGRGAPQADFEMHITPWSSGGMLGGSRSFSAEFSHGVPVEKNRQDVQIKITNDRHRSEWIKLNLVVKTTY